MCDTVVSNDPPLIVYCPDKYITHKMCDQDVDYSLPVLKLIPYWLVTSKMIKKRFTALCANDNICYFDQDSGDVVFNCIEMGILNIDLNNISLNDKFDEDDPDTIILMRLFAWQIKFIKCKKLKKELNEELMPVAWDPDKWWDWCISEDEEKEINPMFIEVL